MAKGNTIPNNATIRRAKTDAPYFIMLRSTAQDPRLSFEALGIITYLLSKPDNWEIQIQDLARQGGCGKTRIYRIIKELINLGYMQDRKQTRNSDGTFSWSSYILHERPKIIRFEENQVVDQPHPENPDMDEPDMDEPDTENREILHSTEEHNTEEHNTSLPPEGEHEDLTSQEDTVQKKSKVVSKETKFDPEDESTSDNGDTKAARQLISVYKTYSKDQSAKIFGWALQDAKNLVEKGITPEDIKNWWEFFNAQDWVRTQPSWNTLVSQIVAWRDKQQEAKTVQARMPHMVPPPPANLHRLETTDSNEDVA